MKSRAVERLQEKHNDNKNTRFLFDDIGDRNVFEIDLVMISEKRHCFYFKSKSDFLKKIGYWSILVGFSVVVLLWTDLRQRAELIIGRLVADMFAFSILRGESNRHGDPQWETSTADRIRADAAQRP